MKRFIHAAEQPSVEDKFNDDLNMLKDDFNFAIDGIAKIAGDGDYNTANELINNLSSMINASIEEMAEAISTQPAGPEE